MESSISDRELNNYDDTIVISIIDITICLTNIVALHSNAILKS